LNKIIQSSPVFFGILVLIFIQVLTWNIEELAGIATILSFIAFILTAAISLKVWSKPRGIIVESTKTEEPENPAIIVGIIGLYGIVNGIGISDALYDYGKLIQTGDISIAPLGLLGIVSIDLPYTFRLIAFLITIIPFVHGAILTTSRRWYKTEYRLAFVFFIVIFIHAILFYLVALNISNIALFVLLLWILMILNAVWIIIQGRITKRNDIFLNEWFFLNFNTFAFLSVIVFVPANLNDIGNSFTLNLLILFVMVSRSVTDYIVGWKDFYNRIPPDKGNQPSGNQPRSSP
jgi:hypothetical protein